MEYKQQEIIQIIQERIASKEYTDYLPRAIDLAEEFHVNPKTVNKAILRLVRRGVLQRKRHEGTRIVNFQGNSTEPVIEIVCCGFTTPFSHPFWKYICDSLLQELSSSGFRTLLNTPKTDGMRSLFPASGRILLGTYGEPLLNRIRETGIPFITTCDPLAPIIPQVAFDFFDGIHDAVDYLYQRGCRKIGFIGQISSYFHPPQLTKFSAYINAVQEYCLVDPECSAGCNPDLGYGAAALRQILNRASPDSLIVASDVLLPEILQLLNERNITIPVIGCDGSDLPTLPANRPLVRAPLTECGRMAAKKIIQAIHTNKPPKSVFLKAKFESGES